MSESVTPWIDCPEESPQEVATKVFEAVQDIERRQSSIHEGHKRHARIYAGYTPVGLQWGDANGIRTREPQEATR